jgi:hypothetical protein
MRRILLIVVLLIAAGTRCSAQVRSWFGELRYQHEYQDTRSAVNGYAKYTRMNPQFVLGVDGHVLSPNIIDFQLLSTMQANYTQYESPLGRVDGKQYLFTFYNLAATLMPGYFVSGTLQSYDQKVETNTSDVMLLRNGITSYRQRRQTAMLTVNQVPELPSMRVLHRSTTNKSDQGLAPYQKTQEEYEFNLSQSTKKTTFSVNAYLNDDNESLTATRTQFTRVFANAAKTLSEGHRLDLTSEYYHNGTYHSFSGGGAYNGTLLDNLQVNASVSGRNQQSPTTFGLLTGFSQTMIFTVDEHVQFVESANGESSRDVTVEDEQHLTSRWHNMMAGITVNHSRQAGVVSFSNMLTGAVTSGRTVGPSKSSSGATANTMDLIFGAVNLALSQSSSIGLIRGFDEHDEIVHTGSATLACNLPLSLRVQGMADVQDERRIRTRVFPFHRRSSRMQGQLMTAQHLLMPLNLFVSAGTIDYAFDNGSRTHSFTWTVQAGTPSFVFDGFSMNYSISRAYDFMTRQAVINQSLLANYQWRAIALQFRLTEFRYIDRKREMWIEIIRAF